MGGDIVQIRTPLPSTPCGSSLSARQQLSGANSNPTSGDLAEIGGARDFADSPSSEIEVV
jgi:hypothetical protein